MAGEAVKVATRFAAFDSEELSELEIALDHRLAETHVFVWRDIAQALNDEAEKERLHRNLGIAKHRDCESYYFGCHLQSGHYFWKPGMKKTNLGYRDMVNDLPFSDIDGGLAPAKGEGQIEGIAKLSHKDGWTALAFWDRSVDHRPGSHSTFLFHAAELPFAVALALARETYPEVFARITYDIKEYR